MNRTQQYTETGVSKIMDRAIYLEASKQEERLDAIATAVRNLTEGFININRGLPDSTIIDVASPEQALLIRGNAIPGPPRPVSDVVREATEIFSHRVRMNHPRFFGFIPCPMSALSWLGDLLNSTYNTHAGSWLQSSGPSAVEEALIGWLAQQAGLPLSAGGVFVSSGSMANLTALMLARDRILQFEERQRGVAYVSDQTHSSIAKGLRILGFRDTQIRRVQSDAHFRMNVSALAEAIKIDREAGLIPFVVIASCGTTNTGSIDPLQAISDLTQAQGLWLHVDGAYGASVVLSKSRGGLVDGLGRADSLSWDAHKWLFQTYGCGIILVREKGHLVESFATDAEYIRDALEAEHCPNFWNYGPELTRPARAMKLWFTLRVLGLEEIRNMIDWGFILTETAEVELRKFPHWEIVSPANMAIVNFRYVLEGKDDNELDALNQAISQRLIQRNIAVALTTKLYGRTVIRICAINPQMTADEMRGVIAALDSAARELSSL